MVDEVAKRQPSNRVAQFGSPVIHPLQLAAASSCAGGYNGGMDENPYKAPAEFMAPNPARKDERWHPFTWGVVGFALGTLVASSLVLSVDRIDRIIGGAVFGGIPTGVFVFLHAADKLRKER